MRRPFFRVPVIFGAAPDDREGMCTGARVHCPLVAPEIAVGIGAFPPHSEPADIEGIVTLRLLRRLAHLRSLRHSPSLGPRPGADVVHRRHLHLVGDRVPQPG